MTSAKRYTMSEAVDVAKQAAEEIEKHLLSLPETLGVINLEDDPYFQGLDIDLAWQTNEGVFLIEIKGDRYYRTGNYFFEVVSNASKNTPGCFMYTQADYIFYYFVEEKELHMLPMPETRDWFSQKMDRYPSRTVSTAVGKGGYRTIGRVVPRQDVKNKKVVRVSPCQIA